MASATELAIEKLKMSLARKIPSETLRLVDSIAMPLEGDGMLSSLEIDLAICKVFDVQQGLLSFLARTIKIHKVYSAANCRVMELFHTLCSGDRNAQVSHYTSVIVPQMLQFVLSGNVSAMEKERATVVLHALVKHGLMDPVSIKDLMSQVLLVFNNAKATGKFLEHVYELLGLISFKYPTALVEAQAVCMRNMFLLTLESAALAQNHVSINALAGATVGLRHLLTHFAPSSTDDPDICRRIYVCMHKFCSPYPDTSYRNVARENFDLLAAHAPLMANHVFADHSFWYSKLLIAFSCTNNAEYHKTLFEAVNAVHGVIAHRCEQENDDAEQSAIETQVLHLYVESFKRTLLNSESKSYDILVAVRGLGLMAGAYLNRFPTTNLIDMLTLMMRRTECLCPTAGVAETAAADTDDAELGFTRAALEHYPDFVRALSQIMQHVHQLTNMQLHSLQAILVSLMRDFCYLPETYHEQTVVALLQTFAELSHIGGVVRDDMLKQCTLQSLIWLCSHKLRIEIEADWETLPAWEDHITVMEFHTLWAGLTVDNFYRPDSPQTRATKRLFYHQLMQSFFIIVERVDLTLRPRRTRAHIDEQSDNDAGCVVDPNRDLEPCRPADFHMLFNLVNLLEHLLPMHTLRANQDVFDSYIGRYFHVLERKSRDHPLISAFIRLITVGLRLASKLNYFNTHPAASPVVLQRFVRTQTDRVQHVQGELQISILYALFSVSVHFLMRLTPAELAAVYQCGFSVGHGQLRVAMAALESLESLKQMGNKYVDDVLRIVLPSLDAYLQTTGSVLGEVGVYRSPVAVNGKSAKSGRTRNRRVLKMIGNYAETELLKFQKFALLFLGSLTQHQCLYMLGPDSDGGADYLNVGEDITASARSADPVAQRNITRPQIDNLVRLTLHFGDVQPTIHLDAFVPRICTLATTAGDRDTKVAACELLHAITLYVIGTRHFESTLWRTLCAHMLQLGSEGDRAVRQMFEPLVEQVMHYMSHPAQLTISAFRVLLDCLMTGMADRSSAVVRELASRSLRVFVEWTMRQNAASAPMVVHEIVEQLRMYSFDADELRRCGAALAFNSICRVVREHDQLVNIIWLDLLYTFAINYQLSEQFGYNASVIKDHQLVDAAMDNVTRVLRERIAMFAVPSNGRTLPEPFAEATLPAAIGWLLSQCGCAQRLFRRKCIAIVQQLAPLVSGYGSLRGYLSATQTVPSLVAICPMPAEVADTPSGPRFSYRRVLAAMDFYMWIVGDAQCDGGAEVLTHSHVLSAVVCVFTRTLNANTSAFTADWHKNCVERAYAFVLKMMPLFPAVFESAQFWTKCSESIGRVTTQLLFESHCQPYYMPRPVLREFLSKYRQVLPYSMSQIIKLYIQRSLASRYEQLLTTTEHILHRTMVAVGVHNSARGILTLLDSGHKFTATTEPLLLQRIFDGLSDQRLDEASVIDLWPDVRDYAGVLLRIAFHTNPFSQLIHMVLNERPLEQRGGGIILHGQHFLNVFGDLIFEKLLSNPDQTFQVMVRQLTADNALFMSDLIRDMVQYVRQTRRYERTVLCEMAVCISLVSWKLTGIHAAIPQNKGNWSAWSALAFANLDLVTHAAVIWPDALIMLGQQFNHLQSFICGLIVSRFANMELKARAIFLLPCLIDHLTESHRLLEDTFGSLQEQHFPILSTEFAEGSMERASFVNVLQALLDALVASRSPALLRFIIDATVADDEHILESAIRQALSQLCRSVASGSSANALIALRVPFKIFDDRRLEPAVRLNVFRRFMIPMLRECGTEAVVRFYGEYLGTVLEWSDYQYGMGAGGWSVEHALVSRIGAFQLIETMAGTVSKERMATEPELQRWLVAPAKSLVSMLSAKTYATRTEVFVTADPTATSLFRRYNCATYSAMCSLVANTQTALPFYEKLLFRENADKNEFIWRRIIDCRDGALFARHMPIEFEELPQRRERLASIQLSADAQPSNGRRAAAIDRLTMQTQNVFDSSFSQDVTKIDLSNVALRCPDMLKAGHTLYTVDLERGPINDHEVMTVLCAVVRSMFDKRITPLPDAAAGERSLVAPAWALHLCAVLTDSSLPRNTRYFIAKLVDNCRAQFQHYAPSMYGAVLAFLVDEFNLEGVGTSKSINYFFNDLLVTLIEWSQVYSLHTAAELETAATVLKFLMRNVWHERRTIFRQRVEIIRHLLTAWLPCAVPLPLQLLVDSLRLSSKPSSLKNMAGLQLNAAVLCCGAQLTWTERLSAYYVKYLLQSIGNEHKQVYRPAGFVLGIVLSKLITRSHDDTDDNPYLRPVIVQLDKYRQSRTEEKRFLDVLFAIHRNYPRIVVSFLLPIASLVSKSHGAMKRKLLEMYQAAMDVYGPDTFRELLALGLLDLLHRSEFETSALHCVNKALPFMNDEQTLQLWPHLLECAQSQNADARAVTCEICVHVVMHATNAQLQTDALAQLLRGLQDSEARIRQRVYDFWMTCDQLPQKIDSRLLGVLGILYAPAVEEHFIGFGTQLVLQLAIESGHSRLPIFPHQSAAATNGDDRLAEYQIDCSFAGRNSSMRAPLFVLAQQHGKYGRTTTQIADIQLLATATDSQLAFEPTQAPAPPSKPTQFDSNTKADSSMMFVVPPLRFDRRSQRVAVPVGQTKAATPTLYALLRERYLTSSSNLDSTRLNPKYALLHQQKVKANVTFGRSVRLFRRYRIGDFPDLLINNLAFLLPLQALARLDRPLASQLFVALYSRVCAALDAGAIRPFLLASSDAVQAILRESKHCDPLVFSTLMQLAQQHPQYFDLPAELVASMAMTNRSLAPAIGYLERRLHYSWDTDGPRSSAKSNSNTVDVEHQHWLKLSELYRALGESDVVAGIFTDKLDVDERIPRALQLESEGDLEAAQRIYLEVIRRGKALETDFAYQSYYELYAAMGDWSALATSCEGQLDNLEDVWADDWAMDTLLPHMMRARCRQVMRRDEASRDFMQRLQVWVRMPARGDLMSAQYGEELMMMHLAAGNVMHARLYGDSKMQTFLTEWPTLSVLSRKIRTDKLLALRTVAEMISTTNILLMSDARVASVNFHALASRWEADQPRCGESPALWETLVAYRSCVVSRVPPTEASLKQLDNAVSLTQFRLLSLALEQRNVSLAQRIVLVVPANRTNERHWQVMRSEHLSLKAAVLGRSVGAQVKLQLKAWDSVQEVLVASEADPSTVRMRAHEVFGDIAFRLAAIVRSADLDDIDPWTSEIAQRLGDPDIDADDLPDRLLFHTFENITARVHCSILQPVLESNCWFTGQDRGNVYFQLATFCQEMCVRNSSLTIADRDRIYIESVFWSMQMGCPKARQSFPRILTMPELHASANLQRIFCSESDLVPAWMFLAWIPQMMSVFSFIRPGFVDLLLLRVAQAFPLAVCYPFQLAYTRHLEDVDDDFKYKDVVIELVCVLMNPTVESFMQALQCLCVPEKKIHYHLRALYIELNGHDDDEDGPFLKSRLRQLTLNMWPEHQQRGRAYDRLEVYRTELQQLESLTNIRDAQETVRTMLSQIDQAMRAKPHQRDTMQTLSPWLSAFHWCGTTNSGPYHVELPGQYTGHQPPNSLQHTRIIKFDERIRIYDTLRQPVRLRCCGNDGRTYTYLVKYGEDLRQDQRVQQLLTLMRQQLRADTNCRGHSLSIETYAVVPINVHCGLLGWVDNSPAMQAVVESWLQRNPPANSGDVATSTLLRTLRTEHEQFIKAASGDRPAAEYRRSEHFYGRAVLRYSRIQLLNAQRGIEQKLPVELVRGALCEMAASAEGFLALRANFTSSLAALSVAHWLLGIGDRHLSNVLLNEHTGRLVGIDFGLSFGAGTRDQNVPELLPFRLTPQFVQALSPFGVSGALQLGMVRALRCWRAGRKLLESCMEVFVREPTIDWLESARNRAHAAVELEEETTTSSSNETVQWEPAQRIDVARRKLRGANPRAVCADELASGKIAAHADYLEGYRRLVAGVQNMNMRARLGDDELTAAEQVQCLLDMATDPALQCISWSGMQPWI